MKTESEQELLQEMESTGLLTREKMTPSEWYQDMEKAAQYSARMILGKDYLEDMGLDEIIVSMKIKARKLNCLQQEDVQKGIATMRDFYHQVVIRRAGKQAEDVVAFRLEQVHRPNVKIYRNVFLSNNETQTELDDVVVTDSGILILEVKNLVDHALLTKDGRLVRLYSQTSECEMIAEKMRIKRELLKQRIRAEMKQRKMAFPLYVDSLIVFRGPSDKKIHIEDDFKQEKWCFDRNVSHQVEVYPGHVKLMPEQLNSLNAIMEDLAEVKMEFAMNDFDVEETKTRFAKALSIMNTEENRMERAEIEKMEKSQKQRNVISPKHLPLDLLMPLLSPIAIASLAFTCSTAFLHFGTLK